MSEKLDGVRAYWSGKAFYSRNGNVFPGACMLLDGNYFDVVALFGGACWICGVFTGLV